MAKLLIIKFANTDMAEIQTTDRLCNYRYYFSPPVDDELSPEFIAFRDELNAIYGLKKIEIGRHEIHMERYEVFEFDDLFPKVIEAMKKFTGTTDYETTIDDRAAKYEQEQAERKSHGIKNDPWDEAYNGDD